MTQLDENKAPGPFLIARISQKLAGRDASSVQYGPRINSHGSLRRVGVRSFLRHPADQRGILSNVRHKPARHEIEGSRIVGEVPYGLAGSHPSRLCTSRRMAAIELLGAQLSLRRSSGLSGSSSLQQRRPVGQRSLVRAQSVAPSSWPAARSASTSRLPYQRMLRGLSRTNLPALGGSGSSWLINLLVFHLAASAVSRCRCLQKHGPQRASNTSQGLNCFLLSPTAFRHDMRPTGSGGYALRDLTAESGFFSVTYGRWIFCFSSPPPHASLILSFHNGIVQFGDRTFHPWRNLLIADTHGLMPGNCP
jgi:hypothetical protein